MSTVPFAWVAVTNTTLSRSGVKPGQEVATSGVFKLRPGAAVVVNNKVTPSNSAAPKPEDS